MFDLLVKQVRDLGVGSILFVCEVRRLNGEREINMCADAARLILFDGGGDV